MYGFRDFRNDWRWLLAATGIVWLVVLVAGDVSGKVGLLQLSLISPVAAAIMAGIFLIAAFVLVLALRSLMRTSHKGWQRVLLLVALAAFLYPVVTGLQRASLPWNDVIVELVAVGLYYATIVILVPQIVVGGLLWIRSSFAAAGASRN